MTIVADKPTHVVASPRDLISPDLFTRLVNRIMREEEVTRDQAERVIVQALAFLRACTLAPETRLAPSKQVDQGWHAFILYTREYTEFCERLAGGYIHHTPDDGPTGPRVDGAEAVSDTVKVMRAAGLPVDDELWFGQPGRCSQCHAGCTDSPMGA